MTTGEQWTMNGPAWGQIVPKGNFELGGWRLLKRACGYQQGNETVHYTREDGATLEVMYWQHRTNAWLRLPDGTCQAYIWKHQKMIRWEPLDQWELGYDD